MKYFRAIRGEFGRHHIEILETNNIKYTVSNSYKKRNKYPMPGAFAIVEDQLYFDLINKFDDIVNLVDRRTSVIFEEEELKSYEYFFLRRIVPGIAEIYSNNTCIGCYRHISPEINYYHYKKEPVLDSKYLFGQCQTYNVSYITDRRRYSIIKEKFGIGSKPIFYGLNKTQSTEYLALDIPVSNSPLDFQDSGYGRIQKHCNTCDTFYYFGDAFELFPKFKEHQDYDICLSQEKFTPYLRGLIVSYNFIEFLVEYGMFKWGPSHIIPVKGNGSLKV